MREARIIRTPDRERFVNCAWHLGGKAIVERKSGVLVREPLLSSLKKNPEISDSHGICERCRDRIYESPDLKRKPLLEARL